MAEQTTPDPAAPAPQPAEEPQVTTEVRRNQGAVPTQDGAPALPAGVTVTPDKYRGPDWAGLANYYCCICEYSTLAGSADVEAHVRHRHLDRYQEIDAAGKLKEA